MAKHKIGKSVSKGERRSNINAGKAKQRPAIIVERVATAMREALLNIKVDASAQGGAIVGHILNSGKQNAGNNKQGRGWTANLAPQTVRKLTNEGVFA